MTRNYWDENADRLSDAYASHCKGLFAQVRFAVVTRKLREILTPGSLIADFGGGFGYQAASLARCGFRVVIVDPERRSTLAARALVNAEPNDTAQRIAIVRAHGETAPMAPDFADAACCHSVLMYLREPEAMLKSLVRHVRPGGTISILSLNPSALAMRTGLQKKWSETTTRLSDDQWKAPFFAHSLERIEAALLAEGACPKERHGVGVFTGHLTREVVPANELDEIVCAEWIAGSQEPYCHVAHLVHILARVGDKRPTAGFREEHGPS